MSLDLKPRRNHAHAISAIEAEKDHTKKLSMCRELLDFLHPSHNDVRNVTRLAMISLCDVVLGLAKAPAKKGK